MNIKSDSSRSNLWFGLIAVCLIGLAVVMIACAPITPVPTAMASSTAATTYHLELFDSDDSGVTTPVDMLTPDDFPGLGDIILEAHDVFDATSEEMLGNTITRVQVVSADSEGDMEFLIDCTVVLANGTFHFTGGGKFSDLGEESGVTVPIVGGTGIYTFAAGTVTMKFGELGEQMGAYITADITTER